MTNEIINSVTILMQLVGVIVLVVVLFAWTFFN